MYIVTLLYNFYAEYIMRNASMDEAQAGINIAKRNINNLRYADDTTLMVENQEELRSLLMKVKKESEKADLKFNMQKTKIMAFSPATTWQTDGKTIALTVRTFAVKVMSLFFNMLSRFVIAFLPRSKHLLISWLQSLAAMILNPPKIVCQSFHFFPIYVP